MRESILSEAETYADQDEEAARRLSFFRDLWRLQDELAAEAPEWLPPSEDEAAKTLKQGRPMLSANRPRIAPDAFRAAVRRVSALAAETGVLDTAISDYLSKVDLAEHARDDMIEAALDDLDAFCAEVGRAADADASGMAAVEFVLAAALTPFLEGVSLAAMAALGSFDWTLWGSGNCPVCATPASIGRIVDSGHLEGAARKLTCPLCRAEWGYDRIRCARCGSRDHTKLRYLFDENDPGHRAHVCDNCLGYLKVSDEREIGRQIEPQVEDVITHMMDAIAQSRGYTRIGTVPPGDS